MFFLELLDLLLNDSSARESEHFELVHGYTVSSKYVHIQSIFNYRSRMLTALNGQERTVGHWVDVAKQSGWKITHFYAPPAALFQHIVAEAV